MASTKIPVEIKEKANSIILHYNQTVYGENSGVEYYATYKAGDEAYPADPGLSFDIFRDFSEEDSDDDQPLWEGMKYFHDDGTEFNPELYPKPGLCLVCENNNNPGEEILCNLNRMDQQGNEDFICYAFKDMSKE